MLTQRKRLLALIVGGVGVVATGAAWSVPPPKLAWQYGELRSALSAVDLRFITADEVTNFELPQQVRFSATRAKLYGIDLLTDAGWEIVSVDQTERDWVYLLRRAR